MQRLRSLIITFGILLGVLSVGAAAAQPVGAINVFGGCSGSNSSVCKDASGGSKAGSLVKNVINLLLFVLGIIAVIMIVVGGIRYTTSDGDPGKTKSARDTILYSVVGLVVAMLAYAIVNFVVAQFS